MKFKTEREYDWYIKGLKDGMHISCESIKSQIKLYENRKEFVDFHYKEVKK